MRLALSKALRERLAGFKRPRHIARLPELPRSTMGRVQKNLLCQDFAGLFA